MSWLFLIFYEEHTVKERKGSRDRRRKGVKEGRREGGRDKGGKKNG